jgi:serine/threonine protein kinase
LGTFDYISPEQALDPRVADIRSDIYSLGCTFYHLLTGVPPVPEGTAAKKLHHHQLIQPDDPRSLNQRVPLMIVEILARMISKNPDQRYQTPAELAADLNVALDQLDHDKPQAPMPRRPASAPSSAGIPRWLVLGSILTVVIVVGLMEWIFAPLDRGGHAPSMLAPPAPALRPLSPE